MHTPSRQRAMLSPRLVAVALALLPGTSSAQVADGPGETHIVRDGSVGPGPEVQPEPIFGDGAGATVVIDESLGERPAGGENLFHSFSRFDLNSQDRALFRADPRIVTTNVIARVTGGVASSLRGTLASDIPGANLFFLNPAGVILGPGAMLDVNGSVHLSTAGALLFADGTRFAADAPGDAPILSVAPPAAFGFLDAPPQPIEVRESFLAVPSGRDLSLTAGSVDVSSSFVSAEAGRVVLLAAGASSVVPVGGNVTDFALLGGVVRLSDTLLGVTGTRGGSLLAAARALDIDTSALLADSLGTAPGLGVTLLGSEQVRISGGLLSTNGAGAPVTIRGGNVRIEGGASIAGELLGEGTGGDLGIFGESIAIDSSVLRRGISGSGGGGAILLEATGVVDIRASDVFTETTSRTAAIGGDLSIAADRLAVRELSRTGTRSTGSGDAGDVSVRAGEALVENAAVGSETTDGSSGRTGDVRIDAGLLALSGALPVGVRSLGSGNSGTVELFADTLTARLSQLSSQTTSGRAGEVRVVVGRLDAMGFDIGSIATAGGRSSDISVRADSLVFTGVIATQSAAGGAGNVLIEAGSARIGPGPAVILSAAALPFENGNIELRVDDLALTQAFVSAGDRNGLSGGDVRISSRSLSLEDSTVTARNQVEIDAEQLRARSDSLIGSESGFPLRSESASNDGTGDTALERSEVVAVPGGDVRITADRIELDSGSRISSTTFSDGRAGDVTVRAGDLQLSNGASIDSRSTGRRGDAGTLRIEADRVELRSGARIATSTNGPGDAGRIELTVAEQLVLDGSRALESAGERDLGSDRPTEISSSALPDPSFLALALAGDAGTIAIRGTDIRVSNGAQVTSSNLGTGRAGSIALSGDRVELSGARISTDAARGPQAGSTADGNIRISSSTSIALDESAISASVGTGQGGSIELVTPGLLLVRNDSSVLAQTEQGSGGQIRLSSSIALQDAESRISADAGVGQAGTVEVNAPELSLDPELAGLEIAYRDPVDRIRPSCEVRPDSPGTLLVTDRKREEIPAWDALGRRADAADLLARRRTHGAQAMPASDAGQAATHARHPDAHAGEVARMRGLAERARSATDSGEHERASELVRLATERLPAVGTGLERVIVKMHLAKTLLRLAESDVELRGPSLLQAHELLMGTLREARDMEDGRVQAFAYGLLARAYRADRRLEEALYLTRMASQASARADASESSYRWHQQEGEILWELGRAEESLEAYRRAVDAVDGAQGELGADPRVRGRAFRREVEPVYLELADRLLQRAAWAEQREEDVTQYLIEARDTVERFKAAELRNYFRDDCTAELESRTAQIDQVAGDAAVVYPVVLGDRLELLVRLPSGLARFRSDVTAAELRAATRQLRETVQDRLTRAYLRPARKLYDWLVAPYAAELTRQGAKTLVFVPDALLRSIPLAALHDGERFLVERYALAVTPGLSLLDPKPLERDGLRLLLAGVSEPVQSFDALPKVPRELAEIQKLFGGQMLLDDAFSAPTLDRAVAEGRPTLLHVASHVVFTGDPASSFVLAHDSKLDLDRFARIIQRTRFREDPLELLVLSACRTAVDDPQADLGLAGIAIRSGARSAVGSLWDLSDEASYELVVAFYRELREPTRSRAEALRRAQVALLDDPELSHPFYWSAFVLVNTWL